MKRSEMQVDVRCLVGRVARYGALSYLVRGWFMDSNGCLKTYGRGYDESFCDLTTYSPNSDIKDLPVSDKKGKED